MTDDDKLLGATMREHWTAFAKNGAPSTSAAVAWPVFNPASPEWMHFNHTVQAEPVTRTAQYDIFNARTARLVEAMASIGVTV